MSIFWISLRSVKQGAFTAEPRDSAAYLSFDGQRHPTPGDIVASPINWAKQLLRDAEQTKNIVIFIHGYNNTIDNVLTRHRLLQTGLTAAGFPCVVVSYDWPSDDKTIAYLEDRHDAKKTAMRLVTDGIKLFQRASTPKCDTNIHIVAHSMGSYVVREAFDDADDTSLNDSSWTIGQLVLIAADLSSNSLESGNSSSESLYRHCYRLTNYFNHEDEALQISNAKRLGFSPRAGRVGLPIEAPPKALDVDCSDHYEQNKAGLEAVVPGSQYLSHSWYFYDATLMSDLAATLKGSVDRNAITSRKWIAENDFKLL